MGGTNSPTMIGLLWRYLHCPWNILCILGVLVRANCSAPQWICHQRRRGSLRWSAHSLVRRALFLSKPSYLSDYLLIYPFIHLYKYTQLPNYLTKYITHIYIYIYTYVNTHTCASTYIHNIYTYTYIYIYSI